VKERVRNLLEKVFDEEFSAIAGVENFRNLEFWDSLMYVNLVIGLQSEFKVNLSKNDIQDLLSVNGIEAVLSRHGIQ